MKTSEKFQTANQEKTLIGHCFSKMLEFPDHFSEMTSTILKKCQTLTEMSGMTDTARQFLVVKLWHNLCKKSLAPQLE